MWTYRCRVRRVVDGDTLDLVVDLGFRVELEVRVRLIGVNAPEVRGPESAAGVEAMRAVEAWVEEKSIVEEWPFYVSTEKLGKYGRWLADIWWEEDGAPAEHLSDLVAEWTRIAKARHGLEKLRYG